MLDPTILLQTFSSLGEGMLDPDCILSPRLPWNYMLFCNAFTLTMVLHSYFIPLLYWSFEHCIKLLATVPMASFSQFICYKLNFCGDSAVVVLWITIEERRILLCPPGVMNHYFLKIMLILIISPNYTTPTVKEHAKIL